MENNENEIEKDEIVNPEQFQVGRSPQEEKEEQSDDAAYTEEEVQFADGEGTQLAEAFDTPEEDEFDEEEPADTEEDSENEKE